MSAASSYGLSKTLAAIGILLIVIVLAAAIYMGSYGGEKATTTTTAAETERGAGETQTTVGPTETTTTQSPALTTATKTESKIKVLVLFDVGGKGDLSFNDMAVLGAERAQKELGVEVDYQTPASVDAMESLLRSVSRSG